VFESPSSWDWERISAQLSLTPRESELVQGALAGKTESDLADAFSCSQHTVHKHFRRIYRKLGISTRTALVLRVVDAVASIGELPPPSGDNCLGDTS